jgi:D-sedoheptulose 7-phosphate isomerase
MQHHILEAVEDGIRAIEFLKKEASLAFIEQAASTIVDCFNGGGKLLIAGNGGSLCDAMHFAEELTGIFRAKRRALPAIALSDPGHLTCTANDIGYEGVFARAVEALGKKGDIFFDDKRQLVQSS